MREGNGRGEQSGAGRGGWVARGECAERLLCRAEPSLLLEGIC